jgi:hypothetical protein
MIEEPLAGFEARREERDGLGGRRDDDHDD